MKKITLYSDNVYAHNPVKYFVKQSYPTLQSKESIAVFIFEKKYIKDSELHAIFYCGAEKIFLKMCEKLLRNLSMTLGGNKLLLVSYESNLQALKCMLKRTITVPFPLPEKNNQYKAKHRTLTSKQKLITKLFAEGLSDNTISVKTSKDIKTIHGLKNKAMQKIGVMSKIEILQNWKFLLFSEELQRQSTQNNKQ